jgi:phage-related protein
LAAHIGLRRLTAYEYILIVRIGWNDHSASLDRWIGSSRKDYLEFPPKVQDNFGFELFLAQTGQHPPSAKLLRGLGSGTVELVDDFDGDAYRAVYTVRFESAVYVLHAFKKRSKQGIKTPQSDLELIKRRRKEAEALDAARTRQESRK